MFRITRNRREPVIDVDQVESIEPAIRAGKVGRYHVDELTAGPMPSDHTWRRWGVGIKRPDGSVVVVPDPGPESTTAR